MSGVTKTGEKSALSSSPPPQVEGFPLISQCEILKFIQMLVDNH
jgi:hypothetical protein